MSRGRPIVLVGLIVSAIAAASGPAAAATLYPPGAFKLRMSNGYFLHGLAIDGEELEAHDEIVLFVGRKGSGVVYFARQGVKVTETTISARLGDIGSVDLHFVPSGKPETETIPCKRHPIEFDSGYYEGRFDFEGEENYAEAHRSRIGGEASFVVSFICRGGLDEGIGGHAPGARLRVRRQWGGDRVEFEATKNSPSRPSRFRASIEERNGNLGIEREVGDAAGPGAFQFDVPGQKAALKPPSPFSGSARLLRRGNQPGRLFGSLTVNFPGRSNVSLRGARGSLQRWVENPSHPFRPAARLLPKLH